jgi:hypothetical protein
MVKFWKIPLKGMQSHWHLMICKNDDRPAGHAHYKGWAFIDPKNKECTNWCSQCFYSFLRQRQRITAEQIEQYGDIAISEQRTSGSITLDRDTRKWKW